MIPLRDQEYIRSRFAQSMTGSVRIDYFTQRKLPIHVPGREECPLCEDVQQVLKELAALTDKIRLNVHEFAESLQEAARLKVDKVPGTVVRGVLNRPLRFYGFFAGQEFPGFIETIIDSSRNKVDLAPETLRQLRKLKKDVRLRLFVTPTCQHCPSMTRLVYRMALESPRIEAEIVEAQEFPQLVERYRIRSVPMLVIDERLVLTGTMSEESLIAQIVHHAQGKTVQPASTTTGESSPVELPRATQGPERRESGLILP